MLNLLKEILPKGLKRKLKRVKWGYKLMTSEDSYLVKTGYIDSILDYSLKNNKSEYTPWMNYPFIAFLEEKLHKKLSVFEYGSGASSLFFAKRVQEVTSIEHDVQWYEQVKKMLKGVENVVLIHLELNDLYPYAIKTIGKDKRYDVVVVDGRKRVRCAKVAYHYLSEKGVLILDDSHRAYYEDGLAFYKSKGFHQLTFKGLKPTGFGIAQTTLLYKPANNCLGI